VNSTLDTTSPSINFTYPTPSNGTITTNTTVQINVSIIESSLGEVKFNWNGTNFTLYNDSLILMYNFDNVSALGENDSYVVDVSDNGHNNTPVGTYLINTTNGRGNVFQVNEVNSYINTTFGKGLDPTTNPFTITLWAFKQDSCNSGDDDHLFGTSKW